MEASVHDLQCRELCKSFDGVYAVDHLSLTIPENSVFSLLGVNGAGKTTTLRMLSTLERPDSGDAILLGHSILREAPLVRRMIGVSPQETAVAPNLTVEENLELMASLCLPQNRRKMRVEACISQLELGPIRRKKAKTLSGGWQRRLSISMGLAVEPKILFLDEPTLGLDVLARRELWQVVRSLKGTVTVLLTTHYLEEAEALSDCVGIMAKGRLCACGTPAQLCARTGCEKFEDAFVALVQGETK